MELDRFKARVYLFFNQVNAWTRHVRAGRPLVRRAFDTAQQAGDLTYAVFSQNNLITNLLASGDPLAEVQHEAEAGLDFARRARFGIVVDFITAQLQLIRTLRGLTPAFGCFEDTEFSEGRFEQHLDEDPSLALAVCWYWIRALQARFFAGAHASALEAASKAQPLLWTSPGLFELPEYHLYAALTQAALCDAAAGPVVVRISKPWPLTTASSRSGPRTVRKISKTAPRWSVPRSLVSRAGMLMQCASMNRPFAPPVQMASSTTRRSPTSLPRISTRRAASRRSTASICETSRYCYLRWGADGKVRQLDELYPNLRERDPLHAPSSMIGTPVEQLDLATVIRVSQAVSSEIVPEKLIDTLMRIAIEQAGAERGLLVLPRGVEQRIAAEAATAADRVIVHLRDEVADGAWLPASVLHYTLRTRESVILDDAAAQSTFAEDAYIREKKARSILCLPLVNQGKLNGVLYLENNLARGVFAPARIAVLKLLASQAATALENTRLYRDLAEREAKIRRLVDANIIGVFIRSVPAGEVDGPIVEANDAFLRMVGYDREDLISGRIRWAELSPPEWRGTDTQAVAELKTTGIVSAYEKEYFRKDGSRVPVLVGAASLENGGVAFVLDLTERKLAERALRDSEELKRRIIESSRDCIKVLDLDGNLLFMSSGGQQLLEIDNIQPYLNTCWINFWRPEDRPKISQALATARAGGIGKFQAFCPSAKGAPRWWEVITTPICNAHGHPEQLLSVSRDITERKQAEVEARRERAALPRDADAARAREPRGDDGAAHGLDRP